VQGGELPGLPEVQAALEHRLRDLGGPPRALQDKVPENSVYLVCQGSLLLGPLGHHLNAPLDLPGNPSPEGTPRDRDYPDETGGVVGILKDGIE